MIDVESRPPVSLAAHPFVGRDVDVRRQVEASGEPVLVMRGLVFAVLVAVPFWALLLLFGWRVVA